MESSEKIFHFLAAATDPNALQMRESDITVRAGQVSHAIDHAGRRILLVPLADDEQVQEDWGSQGVVLGNREFVDGDNMRRFAMLRCELQALEEQFGILCDEVLTTLASSSEDPGGTCARVVARWRELLGPRRDTLLGESQLLGLLAELTFLNRLLRSTPDALSLWAGPGGARFDFKTHSSGVEVKATTSRDRFSVGIHGLHQLESPDQGSLYIWAQRYERVPHGGESVPDRIQELQHAGIPYHALLEKLADTGYFSADADSYTAIRFQAIDDRSFAVVDGFPRLVPDSFLDPSLSDRILSVAYSIDLSDDDRIPGRLANLDSLIDNFLREA